MNSESRFEIKKRKDGEFQFNLVAPNQEIILTSEGYTSLAGCKNGIESVKKNAQDMDRFELLNAKSGSKVYFVLKAGNGQVIGVSQMYADEAARQNGVESVHRFAPTAAIVENL